MFDAKLFLENWYAKNYSFINSSARHKSVFSTFPHRMLEKSYAENECNSILEVGGNIGEHVKFVAQPWESYLLTDVRVIPDSAVLELSKFKVDFEIANVENLKFSDNHFDRVIVTCLLHHLSNPLQALNELKRVTKSQGSIAILLPHDPGFVYRILQKNTTFRAAKKYGIESEARLVHALEHRNNFFSIAELIKSVFANDEIHFSTYPFRIPLFNLNAFSIIKIVKK